MTLNDSTDDYDVDVQNKVTQQTRKLAQTQSSESESSSPEAVFEIERIIRHRKRGGVIEYRVKWAGYDSSYNEWVPEKNFVGPDLIDDYWDEVERKQTRRKSKGRRSITVDVSRKRSSSGTLAGRKRKSKIDDSDDDSEQKDFDRDEVENQEGEQNLKSQPRRRNDSNESSNLKRRKTNANNTTSNNDNDLTGEADPYEFDVNTNEAKRYSNKKSGHKSRLPQSSSKIEQTSTSEPTSTFSNQDIIRNRATVPLDQFDDPVWSNKLSHIITFEAPTELEAFDDPEPRALLQWENGIVSRHRLEEIERYIPHRLNRYYLSKMVLDWDEESGGIEAVSKD